MPGRRLCKILNVTRVISRAAALDWEDTSANPVEAMAASAAGNLATGRIQKWGSYPGVPPWVPDTNKLSASILPFTKMYEEDLYRAPTIDEMHVDYSAPGGSRHPAANPDICFCKPGDVLEVIFILSAQYSILAGSSLPYVRLGSVRSGTTSEFPNIISRNDGNYGADGLSRLWFVVPAGAKTGYLTIMGRRAAATFTATKTAKAEGVFVGHPTLGALVLGEPVPIFVGPNTTGRVIIDGWQVGKTNPDRDPSMECNNLEQYTLPWGAFTNDGSTSTIGSSPLPSHPMQGGYGASSSSPWTGGGSYWPVGFSAQQIHYISTYAKEMVFQVGIGPGGPNSLAQMAIYQMGTFMSSAMVLAPLAGGVGAAAMMGGAFASMFLAAIALGQSSGGGSSIVKLHRRRPLHWWTEKESADQTVAYSSSANTQFLKLYRAPADVLDTTGQTVRSGTLSTFIVMDFSRMRYVPANQLHESIASSGYISSPASSLGFTSTERFKKLDCNGAHAQINLGYDELRPWTVADDGNDSGEPAGESWYYWRGFGKGLSKGIGDGYASYSSTATDVDEGLRGTWRRVSSWGLVTHECPGDSTKATRKNKNFQDAEDNGITTEDDWRYFGGGDGFYAGTKGQGGDLFADENPVDWNSAKGKFFTLPVNYGAETPFAHEVDQHNAGGLDFSNRWDYGTDPEDAPETFCPAGGCNPQGNSTPSIIPIVSLTEGPIAGFQPGGYSICGWNVGDGCWVDRSDPNKECHGGQSPYREWLYPHDPINISREGTRKRYLGAMTPGFSPPPFRHMMTDKVGVTRYKPDSFNMQFFDAYRSEGLGNAGGLYFPYFYASSIGRNDVVGSRVYSEDFKYMGRGATDWGHDARYCMDNKGALGWGGWFFGEKATPGFWLEGRNMNIDIANVQANKGNPRAKINRYERAKRGDDIATLSYFKTSDMDRHKDGVAGICDTVTDGQAKALAGHHYGGWPLNVVQGCGPYHRQAGPACQRELRDPADVDVWYKVLQTEFMGATLPLIPAPKDFNLDGGLEEPADWDFCWEWMGCDRDFMWEDNDNSEQRQAVARAFSHAGWQILIVEPASDPLAGSACGNCKGGGGAKAPLWSGLTPYKTDSEGCVICQGGSPKKWKKVAQGACFDKWTGPDAAGPPNAAGLPGWLLEHDDWISVGECSREDWLDLDAGEGGGGFLGAVNWAKKYRNGEITITTDAGAGSKDPFTGIRYKWKDKEACEEEYCGSETSSTWWGKSQTEDYDCPVDWEYCIKGIIRTYKKPADLDEAVGGIPARMQTKWIRQSDPEGSQTYRGGLSDIPNGKNGMASDYTADCFGEGLLTGGAGGPCQGEGCQNSPCLDQGRNANGTKKTQSHIWGYGNDSHYGFTSLKPSEGCTGILKHDWKGFGFEFWDSGSIPTYQLNEVSYIDIYMGNINKNDRMRNNGQFLLTEKLDNIAVVGAATCSTCEVRVEGASPHYEFQPDEWVVIKIFPNTPGTATPQRAPVLRRYHDGNYLKNGPLNLRNQMIDMVSLGESEDPLQAGEKTCPERPGPDGTSTIQDNPTEELTKTRCLLVPCPPSMTHGVAPCTETLPESRKDECICPNDMANNPLWPDFDNPTWAGPWPGDVHEDCCGTFFGGRYEGNAYQKCFEQIIEKGKCLVYDYLGRPTLGGGAISDTEISHMLQKCDDGTLSGEQCPPKFDVTDAIVDGVAKFGGPDGKYQRQKYKLVGDNKGDNPSGESFWGQDNVRRPFMEAQSFSTSDSPWAPAKTGGTYKGEGHKFPSFDFEREYSESWRSRGPAQIILLEQDEKWSTTGGNDRIHDIFYLGKPPQQGAREEDAPDNTTGLTKRGLFDLGSICEHGGKVGKLSSVGGIPEQNLFQSLLSLSLGKPIGCSMLLGLGDQLVVGDSSSYHKGISYSGKEVKEALSGTSGDAVRPSLFAEDIFNAHHLAPNVRGNTGYDQERPTVFADGPIVTLGKDGIRCQVLSLGGQGSADDNTIVVKIPRGHPKPTQGTSVANVPSATLASDNLWIYGTSRGHYLHFFSHYEPVLIPINIYNGERSGREHKTSIFDDVQAPIVRSVECPVPEVDKKCVECQGVGWKTVFENADIGDCPDCHPTRRSSPCAQKTEELASLGHFESIHDECKYNSLEDCEAKRGCKGDQSQFDYLEKVEISVDAIGARQCDDPRTGLLMVHAYQWQWSNDGSSWADVGAGQGNSWNYEITMRSAGSFPTPRYWRVVVNNCKGQATSSTCDIFGGRTAAEAIQGATGQCAICLTDPAAAMYEPAKKKNPLCVDPSEDAAGQEPCEMLPAIKIDADVIAALTAQGKINAAGSAWTNVDACQEYWARLGEC